MSCIPDLSFEEHSQSKNNDYENENECQISNQDKQRFFFSSFFSQTSLGAAVYKWHYKYSLLLQHFKLHLLSWLCYHLLENAFSVATRSSGILIRVMSRSGMFNRRHNNQC